MRIYMLLRDSDMKELESSIYEGHSDKRNNSSTVLDIIERRLPYIMHPYIKTITRADWISRYSIAQRIIESFTDNRNVFLLGDSCHTHSPKAG